MINNTFKYNNPNFTRLSSDNIVTGQTYLLFGDTWISIDKNSEFVGKTVQEINRGRNENIHFAIRKHE